MSENTFEEQKPYLDAKAAEYKAKARPSKVSDWPLVGFVEKDGVFYPVYRAED